MQDKKARISCTAAAATDRETGRARGFAHVEFADTTAAGKAVALNGELELEGRTLKLDSSAARDSGTPGGRGGGGATEGTTIFVKGFDTSGVR
jgi:nucleolin